MVTFVVVDGAHEAVVTTTDAASAEPQATEGP